MADEKTVIRSINKDGKIVEHARYSIAPFRALVCYLEQSIHKNYKSWNYFSDNFVDAIGKEYQTKSRYINLVKPLSLKRGYAYEVPNSDTIICAFGI